ncbi:Hypothetical protein NocV09_00402760 [Nannochloropsis oceanica]
MTATKTPHLLVSDSETPNQRSEGEDQPECRHDGTEEIKRWHRIQKKAHAQQPTAGSTTCSNSGTSGGTSSDSEDSDGMNPQHLTLSRSSLMAQWGEASSGKAAVNVVKELVEERRDDSQSKYQPQTDNVINKARDLCARIRHQAKVKQREERKHILLQRQKARDLARQAAETARDEGTRNAALRIHAQKEVTEAARRERVLAGEHGYEDKSECFIARNNYHGQRTLSARRKDSLACKRDQERFQAAKSQIDMFYATTLSAREARHQRQASVQQAKASHREEEDKVVRLIQAAKMERLRAGVLKWDRWVKQRAIFIWYVKAQHMRKLQHQHQHQHQQRQKKKQQQEEAETKARVAAAGAALALSFFSFADWAVNAGKWFKWQVDNACAPPRRPKSPSHYLDEC